MILACWGEQPSNTAFTYIYENVPAERVAELFPETSALMNEIQTNIDALHARLVHLCAFLSHLLTNQEQKEN